jgi:hypothetical protein
MHVSLHIDLLHSIAHGRRSAGRHLHSSNTGDKRSCTGRQAPENVRQTYSNRSDESQQGNYREPVATMSPSSNLILSRGHAMNMVVLRPPALHAYLETAVNTGPSMTQGLTN